jgi:hypothetical protein
VLSFFLALWRFSLIREAEIAKGKKEKEGTKERRRGLKANKEAYL